MLHPLIPDDHPLYMILSEVRGFLLSANPSDGQEAHPDAVAIRALYRGNFSLHVNMFLAMFVLTKDLTSTGTALQQAKLLYGLISSPVAMGHLWKVLHELELTHDTSNEGAVFAPVLAGMREVLGSGIPGDYHVPLMYMTRIAQADMLGPFEIFAEPGDEHVDDFLDDILTSRDGEGLMYAHFMLAHFRKSGIMRKAQDKYMNNQRLFVTYEGERYRVTGASRLGDLWLNTDHSATNAYTRRVAFNRAKLQDWSATP